MVEAGRKAWETRRKPKAPTLIQKHERLRRKYGDYKGNISWEVLEREGFKFTDEEKIRLRRIARKDEMTVQTPFGITFLGKPKAKPQRKLYKKDSWVYLPPETSGSKPYRVVEDKGGLVKVAQWNFAMGRETYSEVSRHMIKGEAKAPEPHMGGAVSYNKATGWMQISFSEKPPKHIREGMKSQGFRYRPKSKTWAAKWSTEREAYATALVGKMSEVSIKPNFQKKAEYAEAQALKHHKQSDERYDQFRKELKTIPLGQPILIGHHSEKSHRAHLKRLDRQMKKSMEEKEVAEEYERRAKRYRRKAVGEPPGLIHRRIRKLEAEKRKCEKWRVEGYDPERYTKMIQRLDERLKIEREAYNASGGIATEKLQLKKGDMVRTHIGVARVVRVNPKTVTVSRPVSGQEWKLKLDKSRIYGKVE